jgi:hypothetical protein
MPSVAVHYMELSTKTNSLVMATHGRGVIILDDITPLRQISQDVLAKDVHFFDMKPAVIEEQSSFELLLQNWSLWVITHLQVLKLSIT